MFILSNKQECELDLMPVTSKFIPGLLFGHR